MGQGFSCIPAILLLLIAWSESASLFARARQPSLLTDRKRSTVLQLATFGTQSGFGTSFALTEPTLLGYGRHLLEAPALQPAILTTPTPGPAEPSLFPAGDSSVVIFLQNANTAYNDSVCLDACAHGFTCAWQNAWVWLCHATNVVDHMWVWEPTGLIRSAANDSFARNPEVCLDMCEDFSLGNGACALTAGTNNFNVGWRQCTGRANQVWKRDGLRILNAANGQCLAVAETDCNQFALCNKYLNQTGNPGTMLNVVVQPCIADDPSHQWYLLPQYSQPLLDFIPLNESAQRYPSSDLSISDQVALHTPQAIILEADEPAGRCLAIENEVSCASTNNPGQPVCAWGNVLLQPCTLIDEAATLDQKWVHDNATGVIMPVGSRLGLGANLCMTMCTDDNFANGACGLVRNNVGWQDCTGAANQQWLTEDDGSIMNEQSGFCLSMQQFCKISSRYLTSNLTAGTSTVEGFPLASCAYDILNSPWAQMPYDGTAETVVGIYNVVGGPCTDANNGNLTLLHFSQTVLQGDTSIAGNPEPGAPTPATQARSESSRSSTAAVIGGVVGGICAAAVLALAVLLGVLRRRRRQLRASPHSLSTKASPTSPAATVVDSSHREKLGGWEGSSHAKGYKLDSVDSDLIAPGGLTPVSSTDLDMRAVQTQSSHAPPSSQAPSSSLGAWSLRSNWSEGIIQPDELTFLRRPDGSDWELGSGAFGTVYKALRGGVQPVAVKVLRDPTEKQLLAFRREVSLLQGLRDPHVVQFLGVCQAHGRVMLVTEFMQGGDLWNALAHTKSGRLNWYARGRQIALDIARGLVHLHSSGVIHLDLKSPNILLGRDTMAKIADVGLARSVTSDAAGLSQMTAGMGTLAWAAPELLRNFRIGGDPQLRAITHKADVFSYGVVLWEIVTGEDPSKSPREARVPSECPKQVSELIAACVMEEPSKRPDMRAVYEALKFAANLPDPRPSEERGINRIASAFTSPEDDGARQPVADPGPQGTAAPAPASAPLYRPSALSADR